MKKIFTILLTVSLFLGLSTSVFAAIDGEHAEGLQLIEQANLEIDKKIEEAVKEADKLQNNYLSEVRKKETEQERTNSDRKVTKLNEEIDRLTTEYNEKLDEIIDSVYEETLQISKETITKAAEYGIIAECSWVLVKFADRSVWIDPIKVVGEN